MTITTVNIFLLLATLITFGTWFFIWRTKWGYIIRTGGYDKEAYLKNPNLSTSIKLLYIAWIIEITAAIVSFRIGSLLVFGNTDYTTEEIIARGGDISGLLFFLLGVVELSRIPLVISIYRSAKIWWKIFGTIFLVIIMIVTFESMLVGFEINSTFMTAKQNKILNLIQNNKEEISNLELKILEITTLNEETIRLNFKNDLTFYENQRKQTQEENDNRIQSSNDKRKERLDESLKMLKESNLRRVDALRSYEEKRNELRAKTNSESQQLLRNTLINKIEIRDSLSSSKEKSKNEARSIYDKSRENKRINQSNIQDTKNQNINNLTQQLDKEKKDFKDLKTSELQEKRRGYRTRIKEATKISNERQEYIVKQISVLRSEINLSLTDLNIQLNNLEKSFNNQLINIDNEYVKKEKSINIEIDKLNKVLEDRIIIDTESVEEELLNIEEEIKKINIQFDLENENINNNRIEISKAFDDERTSLNQKKNNTNEEYEIIKKNLEEKRDNKIKDLKNQTLKVEKLQEDKNDIIENNINIKENYNELASGSVIHNFALKIPMWLYSPCGVINNEGVIIPAQNVSDITPDCLDFTETIWFGAMALVVAMTGTAVAFGSEVLRATHTPNKRTNTGIILLRILKFLRRPRIKKIVETKTVKQIDTVVKEVIKEVPVEKVVPTEVLKEKLVKQVVHIPVYTNDPALLNQSHNEKTEKDKKKK